MHYKSLCSKIALRRSEVYYFRQMMSRILSKRLLPIFIIGMCVIFAMKTAAQMPSLAEHVFQKHQTILLSADVQAVLPEVLVELKKPENQELLTPVLIEAVLENPDLLKRIIPEISDEFITLLKQEDSDIRVLFSDSEFQTLLQMPDAIDELLHLLEAAEPSLATQIFERYEPVFQRQDIRELLPVVLTTLKQPDTQALLRPALIKLITQNPDHLKIIVPEIDDKFIVLLKEDSEVNTLINDPDFHVLLQDPDGINELAVLLDVDTVATVGIAPMSIESPDVGDQFAIAVVISNAHNVRGYHLSVQFDPEALRYVSAQQGNYLSGDVFAAPVTVESDRIPFVETAPMKAESTQGVLLTIMFEVVAANASILSLSDVMLISGEGIALPVKTEDSEIVEPMPVEAEDNEIVEVEPMETGDSEIVEPIPMGTEDGETVESMPVETEDGVEVAPMETEDSEVIESDSMETEDGVEVEPMETEDSEIVEPISVETEDGEVAEPDSAETEDGVEVAPVETEDGEVAEPDSAETEDGVEHSTPAWDVNDDNFVNILDLVLVSSDMGQEGPTSTDVNGDNVVNILDLVLVASHLGEYYEEP